MTVARPTTRLAGLLALLAVLAVAFPALASAHASLERSTPAAGAVLDQAPRQVLFVFSEHVEGSFGALRVVDEHGKRVDDGQVSRPKGRPDALAIGVRPGTPHGAFAATYRVISADGHPVVGGVTFAVGRDVTAAPPDIRALTADQAAPAGIGTALSAVRVLRYLGIGGVCGLLVLVIVLWLPLRRAGRVPDEADEAFVGAAARWLRAIAGVGLVGALLAVVLQAANAGGTGIGDALRVDTIRDVLGTKTGAWFLVSAVAFAGVALVAGRAVRATSVRTPALLAAVLLLAVLVVSPALGGHAAASSPAWALVPLQIVHVAMMGAWIGGLLTLLLVLPRATRAVVAGPQRTRLLAAVLLRFSPIALVSVASLTAAGTVLAILHLTTLYDLTDTAYGRAVLIKAVLLVTAVGVAVVQREWLVPRLRKAADGAERATADARRPATAPTDGVTTDGPAATDGASAAPEGEPLASGPAVPTVATAGRQIRLALRAEVLLLVAVLAVTGALAGYAPPKSLLSGPATVTRTVGEVQLQLIVDPARTGANAMHLYAFDRRGQPVTGAKELEVRAIPPGRSGGSDVPVKVPFVVAGPGHWTAAAVPLGTPGGWKIEVVLRRSAFDQTETTLPVRIR